MTKTELKQRLYEIAIKEVKESGYSFTQPVTTELKGLISTGVERMTSNDIDSEEKTQLAISNIKRLMHDMTKIDISKNGKRKNGRLIYYRSISDSNRSFDLRTFRYARLSICPL